MLNVIQDLYCVKSQWCMQRASMPGKGLQRLYGCLPLNPECMIKEKGWICYACSLKYPGGYVFLLLKERVLTKYFIFSKRFEFAYEAFCQITKRICVPFDKTQNCILCPDEVSSLILI